jgi:hypothetical protein
MDVSPIVPLERLNDPLKLVFQTEALVHTSSHYRLSHKSLAFSDNPLSRPHPSPYHHPERMYRHHLCFRYINHHIYCGQVPQ